MHESESESFNASREVKNNRKIKRKGKKIIHNCCILIKKPDGSEEIVIKQFHDICRLKTKACIEKKMNELQIEKDSAIAKGRLLGIKKMLELKEPTENQSFESKGPVSTISNELIEKSKNQCQETICTQLYFPPYFFLVPPTYGFQIL